MAMLEHLQPERVFYYFEELTKIPHGSYDTRKISNYLVDFAKKHNLKYHQDQSDNVIIYKPASPGYENAPVTILQGHMDMVCEKSEESNHDFQRDPLDIYVENDYITAKGTTLGADNGIAIAYALAILEDDSILHPALEVVITSDEEVGLIGAGALDYSKLKGRYMINMDSETEGEITVSCAGGLSGISNIPLHYWEADGLYLDLEIKGLKGGHSGVDIDKKRANANIIMGRMLCELADICDYMIADLNGGKKDNAIPRMCNAALIVSKEDASIVLNYAETFNKTMLSEYAFSDDGIEINVIPRSSGTYQVLDMPSKLKVLLMLRNIPNGIIKMSGAIEGLPETSTNVGVVKIEDNCFTVISGVRSSIESARKDVSNKIRLLTEFLGGDYEEHGAYPGWEYKADSKLRNLMCGIYKDMYQEEIKVLAIHAGLECGVFCDNIPGLDCVSMGPDLKDVHTTEEMLSISSAKRVWEYLLTVLKEIKE